MKKSKSQSRPVRNIEVMGRGNEASGRKEDSQGKSSILEVMGGEGLYGSRGLSTASNLTRLMRK